MATKVSQSIHNKHVVTIYLFLPISLTSLMYIYSMLMLLLLTTCDELFSCKTEFVFKKRHKILYSHTYFCTKAVVGKNVHNKNSRYVTPLSRQTVRYNHRRSQHVPECVAESHMADNSTGGQKTSCTRVGCKAIAHTTISIIVNYQCTKSCVYEKFFRWWR
jgi:hypothetical protein